MANKAQRDRHEAVMHRVSKPEKDDDTDFADMEQDVAEISVKDSVQNLEKRAAALDDRLDQLWCVVRGTASMRNASLTKSTSPKNGLINYLERTQSHLSRAHNTVSDVENYLVGRSVPLKSMD